VSFRGRQRRRRAKLLARQAVLAARRNHSPETAVRYWLRHVRYPTRCVACGCRLRRGAEMVYRHAGPVILCVSCADADPLVEYGTSAAWEARRRLDRKAGGR
jgi:hypothetical protein